MKNKTAVVFGGTGFLGRQIVRELASAGAQVRVVSRAAEMGYFLKPCGEIGQIVPISCDYDEYDSIARAVEGADYVVNCIGILFERGKKRTFQRIHVDIAENIALACAVAKVKRFVHISALGTEASKSHYAKSKREGERVVHDAFPEVVILRPSVMFGADDNFFNKFASLCMVMPALPLIGGGKTKFQPVYVGDVADAVMAVLSGSNACEGQVYELGGAEIVSFREIYDRMFEQTQRPKMLIYLPFAIAKIDAAFLSLLPNPLLTIDQVESLKTDSVVCAKARGLKDLGISPTGMDVILPRYLGRYRPGGKFAEQKAV